MKAARAKILLHKSFITNQDLIENIRNQSFVSARPANSRVHTQKSHVSLLKKKSYERIQTLPADKENVSYISNRGSRVEEEVKGESKKIYKNVGEKAVGLLQDCLVGLGESNQKLQHKLKKVLVYVRQMIQGSSQVQKMNQAHLTELKCLHDSQLESQHLQYTILQKQNSQLKQKLQQYRLKILSIRSQTSKIAKDKPITDLHQLLINQSQIIDQQCDQYQQQNNQIKRIMKTQALALEECIRKGDQKSKKKDDTREWTSLGNSFLAIKPR